MSLEHNYITPYFKLETGIRRIIVINQQLVLYY
jgi:hypothetical protein